MTAPDPDERPGPDEPPAAVPGRAAVPDGPGGPGGSASAGSPESAGPGTESGGGPAVPLNPRGPHDGSVLPPAEPSPRPHRRVRRFRSARRVPATIVALLVLAGAGLMLYDVSAVRAGHRAMSWRVTVARELARRPLDDTWVLAGAAAATALGLWLLLLAATPGLRQVLPMLPGPGSVRAGLDRDAVALVLRDRALEVPGVQSVRVGVGRRRARVRAESHFRALEDVREDLGTALAEARRGLGLRRPPRLALSVRRAGKG